jgi:hypothetical protein
MAIHFNTGPYVFSHGCAPRGYGMWGFFFHGDAQPWFTHGTYAAAKKAAVAEAKRRACRVVAVAP